MSTVPEPVPVPDVPVAFTSTVLEAFESRPGARFTMLLSGRPGAHRPVVLREPVRSDHGRRPEGERHLVATRRRLGDERVVAPDDPDANQGLVAPQSHLHAERSAAHRFPEEPETNPTRTTCSPKRPLSSQSLATLALLFKVGRAFKW